MKSLPLACVLALVPALLAGKETRVERVRSTTPAQDAKSNSDAVPGVYAVEGKFERVVVLRFKYQTDLLAGLEQIVKEQKIRNAVILSAFGSVRGFHIHTVSNRTFPSKDIYVQDPEAPADIISMNGYVINGQVHPHITLANPDRAFGGHLEPGTTVFTFAAVTLGVLADGIDLTHLDDKTYR
jgi:uncharacterized protein